MSLSKEAKQTIAERIKFLQEIDKGKFDPEAKMEEIKEKEAEITKLQSEIIVLKTEMASYYQATGLAAPSDAGGLTDEQIEDKITAVMSSLPNGANGREISAAIADHRLPPEAIGEFYKREGQTVLKKVRDANGKIGVGSKTKYLLATKADAATIAADQKEEAEIKEARKAKQEAKNK